jgi:Flp pilus assembly protein TadD
MSLLADLLARIKQPASKRAVPPNLRSIVQASAKQSGNRKKIVFVVCIFAAAVASGLLLTYFGRSLMETDSSIPMPAGTGAAKTDAPSRHTNDVPEPVSVPQTVNARQKTPVEPETAIPDNEQMVTENPVTAPGPVHEKPAQQEEEQKQLPVMKTESSGQSGTKTPTKQEAAQGKDAFLYAARKFEMNNDYLNALANYKHALKLDADNFTVMNNIAFMYLKVNLFNDAMTYAQMALDLNGDYVPALINMAVAHARSGNYDDAERYLMHAEDLDPDNETILLNLAVLNERQGNLPEALDLYSRLARLGSSEGQLGEARIYERLGNVQEAIERYKDISISEAVDDAVKIRAKERLLLLLKKR